MCGIVGYKGSKKASIILLEALKQLEYRGYDSVGMATLVENKILLRKDVGRVDAVNNKLDFLSMPGNIGIAHTRWSTTGAVTQKNAHPHLSNDKKIAVVHNGIVENYQELRGFLKEKGFTFQSETDTEIIPNFIQYYMANGDDFETAVRKTLLELEGYFAIVAMLQGSDKIIGARRGSPLVLGVGKDEFFLASDIPAFLEFTNKVVYLDDDEMVVINGDYNILNFQKNKEIKKQINEIEWSVEQAQKGEYPHFMLKEIHEQKFTVKQAIEHSPKLIKTVTDAIKNAYGVFFVGCGTSYHACVSSAYLFSKVAKKHVNVVLASEFRNYEHFLTDRTLMIAVSQSGETADLLDAVKVAKKHGVKIIAVVNVMGSTLMRLADHTILMNAGPEICVLSTKSYTSQIAIMLMLAYSVAGKFKQGKAILDKAAGLVESVIEQNEPKLKTLAKQLKDQHDFFLIGRDLAFPSALEGALKIKEVSYIHAEGFAGGELKHGTIALIDKGVPTIVLSTRETKKLILSNAMEIKSRGGYIIGIDEKNNSVFDAFIEVPSVGDADPILMIIPIQILAYYLALYKGCDPDKPRNLAKSVTVK